MTILCIRLPTWLQAKVAVNSTARHESMKIDCYVAITKRWEAVCFYSLTLRAQQICLGLTIIAQNGDNNGGD